MSLDREYKCRNIIAYGDEADRCTPELEVVIKYKALEVLHNFTPTFLQRPRVGRTMQLRGQVDGMPFCVIERTLSQGIFAGLPFLLQWAGRLSRLTRPPVCLLYTSPSPRDS